MLSDKLYSAVRLMNFISVPFSFLISLSFSLQISQPYERNGIATILTYILAVEVVLRLNLVSKSRLQLQKFIKNIYF
jgi:hypothetical protein